MRHVVRILLAGEPPNLFGSIGDKQFSTSGSNVTATMALVDLKLLDVLAEPQQIALSLLEYSRQLRRHLLLFDDHWLIHNPMIIELAETGQLHRGNRVLSWTIFFRYCSNLVSTDLVER